jgi:hypothetical protein
VQRFEAARVKVDPEAPPAASGDPKLETGDMAMEALKVAGGTGRWAAAGAVRGLAAAAIALLVVIASPQAAHAQFGMMGGLGGGAGELTEMAVTRQSMVGYCGLMGMGETERELALELHAGYLDNYKQMADKFQRQMERMQREVQETRDFSVYQEKMPAMFRDLMKRMEELEEGIFADLRMLGAVAETDERWVRVQRMRRREQTRYTTMISGDAVDLVAVVRGLEGVGDDPPAPVTEALLRYEVELDSVLLERERLMKTAMKKGAEAMEDMFDQEKQLENMKFWEEFATKSQELGRRAKGINARHAAAVQQLLEEGARGSFDREVKRLTWPAVYRDSHAERLLGAAEGMSDATDEQKAQLASIRREYEASAGAINSRWAGLIDKREEQSEGFSGYFAFGDDEESDEGKAKSERRDLDTRTAERIKQVLTAAQQDRLPGEYDLEEDDGG